MEQSTLREQNRTGIYVQESVGATTTGDGLAPQGDKSPVTTNYNDRSRSSICEENNTFDEQNPFKRSHSKVDSISENEYEGMDMIFTTRQNKFRKARNEEMRKRLLGLGFKRQEIILMQEALEQERKDRHNQNKLKRLCEETQLEPQTLKETWLERKERELAKFKAEKAAKIAAGTFNPLSFRERIERDKKLRQEARMQQKTPLKTSDERREKRSVRSPGVKELVKGFELEQKTFRRTYDQLFRSPGILAGEKEDDNPNSFRNKKLFMKERSPIRRDPEYEYFHRQMNLGERHMICISPSDLEFRIPKIKELVTANPKRKQAHKSMVRAIENDLDAKYPIIVRIVDKSNPFGQISLENHQILLEAIIATIKEERALGAHWIKIGPYSFKLKFLTLRCKNEETTRLLESRMPFYNRLWPGANLYIDYSKEVPRFTRRKIKVDIPSHNLTSYEFLKIIKKQNGYPTEYWEVYYKNEDISTFWAIMAIDQESYDRLVESKGVVYFFFDRITLDLNPKKP